MPTDRDAQTRCHFCRNIRSGERFTFWEAKLLSSTTTSSFLSRARIKTTRYGGMKRVGVFVCYPCVRSTVLTGFAPYLIVCMLVTGVCIATGLRFSDSSSIQWTTLAIGVAATLLALIGLLVAIRPQAGARFADNMVLKRAKPHFLAKGKGDSYFTESEYDRLFAGQGYGGAETAEELLAGSRDADFRDDVPVRVGVASSADLMRCPECAKLTSGTQKHCRHCNSRLP